MSDRRDTAEQRAPKTVEALARLRARARFERPYVDAALVELRALAAENDRLLEALREQERRIEAGVALGQEMMRDLEDAEAIGAISGVLVSLGSRTIDRLTASRARAALGDGGER